MLLTGRQLLTQLFDLTLHLRHFLFFLRFIRADFPDGLLGRGQFFLQIGILRDQHLHPFLRLFGVFQVVEQRSALFREFFASSCLLLFRRDSAFLG